MNNSFKSKYVSPPQKSNAGRNMVFFALACLAVFLQISMLIGFLAVRV